MKLLVISGSMGSGKTTVLAEASDILDMRAIPHAAIDLDGLAVAHLPSSEGDGGLMYGNLASVWANCAAAGLTALLVARAVEDRAELERIRSAVADGGKEAALQKMKSLGPHAAWGPLPEGGPYEGKVKDAGVEPSATEIVVCRLTARLETMQERVRGRETGMHQQKFVDRVAELDKALDRARLENFSVENDGRSVTDVALEVLTRAEWI